MAKLSDTIISFRQKVTPKYLRKNRHYLGHGQLSSTTCTKVPSQKQTLFGAGTAFVNNLHQSTFVKTDTTWGMVVNVSPRFGANSWKTDKI